MNGKQWTFAIGTTSRVPGRPGWHYLIIDIDGPWPDTMRDVWEPDWRKQQTPHGWHVYTPITGPSLPWMLSVAAVMGADPVWCNIANKRGYAFLADRAPIRLPWPVERMVIGK